MRGRVVARTETTQAKANPTQTRRTGTVVPWVGAVYVRLTASCARCARVRSLLPCNYAKGRLATTSEIAKLKLLVRPIGRRRVHAL